MLVPMRALTKFDRVRVLQTLQARCSSGNVVALRTRALILLALDSGLRVQECTRLDLVQLLEDSDSEAVRFRRAFYLSPKQAKGGPVGAGMVTVSERARAALRAYVLAARKAGWMAWPPKLGAPVFVGHRLQRGRPGHGRLSVRAAQWSWHDAQRRAGISAKYGFHALRHDAVTRLRLAGADVFDLMRAFRWRDVKHAQRYVHDIDASARAAKLQKAAAKL